jgi:DNA-binding NtrC family response regulator
MGTAHRSAKILVLDDDRDTADLLAATLVHAGYEAVAVTDGDAALAKLDTETFDALLTDLHLDGTDGLDVCRKAIERCPDLPVVVVTGNTSLESAVSAMRAGAHDFVTKPIDNDVLLLTMQRAVKHHLLHDEVARLRRSLAEVNPSRQGLVGDSRGMERVRELVRRVARTDATVLITGESGTGKELVARAVHQESSRCEGPFVALNCAAVPAQLLESELFGHVRGAFTDARSARRGLFLEASGGTLFLDEIAEMPTEMQVKLLRALQERTVRPVGGNEEVPFDARIIAATNRDLDAEVGAGRFREDLYYRINVVGVHVPPLRERPGDIAELAGHFIQRFAERFGKPVTGLGPAVLDRLLAYDWPGNVRELENSIERAVALATGEQVTVDDLPARVKSRAVEATAVVPEASGRLVTLDELEKSYIHHVLRVLGSNKSMAARVLGIDRRTLYRRLEQFEKEPMPAPVREDVRSSPESPVGS